MAGILTIQIKPVTKDKSINFRKIEHFVKQYNAKSMDLIVLPELFDTGSACSTPAMENGGESIEFVRNLAVKYNTNIVAGSILRLKGDKPYNTSFAINRSGEVIQTYDKIHLNDYFGSLESQNVTAGENLAIAEFDFARVGMAIGFDIRFPAHFTKLVKSNVDIIVLPTSWLIPKEVYEAEEMLKVAKSMWLSICKTRAYDNGVYFVTASQTKEITPGNYGLGNSLIMAPTAQILAQIDEKEGGIYAEADINLVKYMRQIFPVAKLD